MKVRVTYNYHDRELGFEKHIGDELNVTDERGQVLIACGQTCKTVPKISSIYYFDPGTHTEGDGYLYQNRTLSDVFVFPNGKDGKVDSVYVDVDTTEYTEV